MAFILVLKARFYKLMLNNNFFVHQLCLCINKLDLQCPLWYWPLRSASIAVTSNLASHRSLSSLCSQYPHHPPTSLCFLAGETMRIASSEFADDPCSSVKRGTMVRAARALLSAVTRLLILADMADVMRLLSHLKIVRM